MISAVLDAAELVIVDRLNVTYKGTMVRGCGEVIRVPSIQTETDKIAALLA